MSYASGKKALGICDLCGLKFKLNELKSVVNNGVRTSHLACRSCWTPDHPQNFANRMRVVDAVALRNPRPEKSLDDIRNITWSWNPVRAFESQGQIGEITVTVTA